MKTKKLHTVTSNTAEYLLCPFISQTWLVTCIRQTEQRKAVRCLNPIKSRVNREKLSFYSLSFSFPTMHDFQKVVECLLLVVTPRNTMFMYIMYTMNDAKIEIMFLCVYDIIRFSFSHNVWASMKPSWLKGSCTPVLHVF